MKDFATVLKTLLSRLRAVEKRTAHLPPKDLAAQRRCRHIYQAPAATWGVDDDLGSLYRQPPHPSPAERVLKRSTRRRASVPEAPLPPRAPHRSLASRLQINSVPTPKGLLSSWIKTSTGSK